QTVKRTALGVHSPVDREEWEAEIEDGIPDLKAARGTALEPLLNKKLHRALVPIFKTRVHRKTYRIDREATSIELTIDQGHVQAGKRSSRICEVELELKRGRELQLFALAHRFARRAPIMLSTTTKAVVGFDLLAGQLESPTKAAPIQLPAKQCAGDAFR